MALGSKIAPYKPRQFERLVYSMVISSRKNARDAYGNRYGVGFGIQPGIGGGGRGLIGPVGEVGGELGDEGGVWAVFPDAVGDRRSVDRGFWISSEGVIDELGLLGRFWIYGVAVGGGPGGIAYFGGCWAAIWEIGWLPSLRGRWWGAGFRALGNHRRRR